jgi:hypothetical protein
MKRLFGFIHPVVVQFIEREIVAKNLEYPINRTTADLNIPIKRAILEMGINLSDSAVS